MVAEDDERVAAHIVRRRGALGIDEAEVAVGRREGNAALEELAVARERLDERVVRMLSALLPGDERIEVRKKALESARMEARLDLGRRQQERPVEIVGAALRQGVEGAHRVELVAEEFGADRLVHGGRPDVEDAAAQGELADALDHRAAGIARVFQLSEKVLKLVGGAGAQKDARGKEDLARHGPEREGLEGDELEARLSLGERAQLPQALLLPAAGDALRIVERQVARRQERRGLAEEGAELRLQPGGRRVVLADHDDRPLRVRGQGGNQVALCDLARAGERGGMAGGDAVEEPPVGGQALQGREQDVHRYLVFRRAADFQGSAPMTKRAKSGWAPFA